jgi:hypothetical protein
MKEKLLGMYFQVAERDGRRFNALLAGRGLKKKDVFGAFLREYNSGTARAAAQEAKAQKGGEKAA